MFLVGGIEKSTVTVLSSSPLVPPHCTPITSTMCVLLWVCCWLLLLWCCGWWPSSKHVTFFVIRFRTGRLNLILSTLRPSLESTLQPSIIINQRPPLFISTLRPPIMISTLRPPALPPPKESRIQKQQMVMTPKDDEDHLHPLLSFAAENSNLSVCFPSCSSYFWSATFPFWPTLLLGWFTSVVSLALTATTRPTDWTATRSIFFGPPE